MAKRRADKKKKKTMHIAQHTKTYLAQMDADNKKNGTKTITNNFNQNQLENLF